MTYGIGDLDASAAPYTPSSQRRSAVPLDTAALVSKLSSRSPSECLEGLGALNKMKADSAVVAQVCETLGNEGACEAVGGALSAFSDDTSVVIQALAATINLSRKSAANRKRFGECGLPDLCLSALSTYRAHPGIQSYGCWVLSNLAVPPAKDSSDSSDSSSSDSSDSSSSENDLFRPVHCAAVVDAMCAHPLDLAVQEHGCRAIINLSLNPENQEALGCCGACEALVAALKDCACEVGTVQKLGRWALRNLALNAPNNEQRLRDLDANAAVVASLKTHRSGSSGGPSAEASSSWDAHVPRKRPTPLQHKLDVSAIAVEGDDAPSKAKIARATIESDLSKLGLDSAEWPDLYAKLFKLDFAPGAWADVLDQVRHNLNLTQL